jgi:hypothetical protein
MYYVKKIAIGIIGWTLGFLIIRLTGLDDVRFLSNGIPILIAVIAMGVADRWLARVH